MNTQTRDLKLSQQIYTSLRDFGLLRHSVVNCQVEQGTVTLSGRLTSWYHAQMAQEIAAKVGDIRRVVNTITVCKDKTTRPSENQWSKLQCAECQQQVPAML